MIPGMKNHLFCAQAGGVVWRAGFWHWCIPESQPWDTLQLGQEGACEGLVVAAVAHPRLSWRDTRAGGNSSVPTARWSLLSSHSCVCVLSFSLPWFLSMSGNDALGGHGHMGRACQGKGTFQASLGGWGSAFPRVGFPVLVSPLSREASQGIRYSRS